MRLNLNFKILLIVSAILIGVVACLIKYSIALQAETTLNNAYQQQLNSIKLVGEELNTTLSSSLNTLRQLGGLRLSAEQGSNIDILIRNQQDVQRLYLFRVDANPTLDYASSKDYGLELKTIEDFLKTITTDLEFKILRLEDDNLALILKDQEGEIIKYWVGVVNLSHLLNKSESIKLLDLESKEVILENTKTLFWTITPEHLSKMMNVKAVIGNLEVTAEDRKLLVSFYRTNFNILVISEQPMIYIMGGIYENIQNMILITLIGLSIGLVLVSLFVNKISRPIEELCLATAEVGKGKFDLNLSHKSDDELGRLTKYFQIMATKIKNLLAEQVQKVRLETEMNIAATVQKTLFPPLEIHEAGFSLKSYHQAASECGGDLWNYFQVGSKLVVMIGDATGHGLPSALITVSVRNTFSIIKRLIEQDKMQANPADILAYANRGVFEVSQGKILMTLFVAVIDLENKTLAFSNAGHNPPWLYSDNKFCSLTLAGTRLGEKEEPDVYKTKQVSLKAEDKIFFYTDGLTEAENALKQTYGKKRVRELLEQKFNLRHLLNNYQEFLNGHKYDDDLTLVLLELDLNSQLLKKAA